MHANSGFLSPLLWQFNDAKLLRMFSEHPMKLNNYHASAAFFSVSSMLETENGYHFFLYECIWIYILDIIKKSNLMQKAGDPTFTHCSQTKEMYRNNPTISVSYESYKVVPDSPWWRLVAPVLSNTYITVTENVDFPLLQFLWIDFVCFLCKCLFAICVSHNVHVYL